MKTGFQLSFKKDSLDGQVYIDLFNKYVKFEPHSFTKKHTTKAWDERKHKKTIAEANNADTIIVGGKDYNIFITSDTGTRNPHRSIEIVQEKELFFPTNDQVKGIIGIDGFISCYLYDEEYVDVQSTKFESNLRDKNLSIELLDTIKDTPWKQGVHSREFDVRFNPGRKFLIGNTWLVAAWKMWFGMPFFELVSKEKILTFPHAVEIKEFPTGQVYVQLFNKIEESHTRENRFIQWKWQEWLNFDALIEKYP
jgi:hypothetical protein